MSTAVAERKPKTRKRATAKRAAKPPSQQVVSNRCTARKKNGEPCTRTKKAGMEVCASHAGTAHAISKRTPERVKLILQALTACLGRRDAATYAGISHSTLEDWLTEGRKAREAGADNELVQFLVQVEQVEVQAKMRLVGGAAAGDARVKLELAARKWPEEFGRKDVHTHEHSGTVGVEHMLGGRQPFQLTEDAQNKIIALIEEENPEPIDSTAEDE